MKSLIAIVALIMAGCASFQSAGTATYTVRPIVTETQIVCCEVTVTNGKEYASLKAHIAKSGDNYTVDLEEQTVAAFKGQEIAAGASKSVVETAVGLGRAAVNASAISTGLGVLGGGLKP